MVTVTIWTRTGNFWLTELSDVAEAGRLVAQWHEQLDTVDDKLLKLYNPADKVLTFIHYQDVESISYPVEGNT